MTSIPVVLLNGGGRPLPVIGMRTGAYPLPAPELLRSAVLDAIALCYRHFDTGSLYNTERPLGEAVAEALRRGLIQSRDELFIASKLWCTDAHLHRVLPALRQSLRNLQLEYLDLYLVHWPVSLKPTDEAKFPSDIEGGLPIDITSVWKAMEECHALGLTKSVGVEMHPVWQQKKLMEFCKDKGIQATVMF